MCLYETDVNSRVASIALNRQLTKESIEQQMLQHNISLIAIHSIVRGGYWSSGSIHGCQSMGPKLDSS